MPELDALFPSKYLKSSQIKGHEVTVIMSHLDIEEVGNDDKQERKPILYFQGKEKGLVLNRTNGDSIADMYGTNTDEWTGKEITLFVMRVRGPNGPTDGIRVKAPLRRNGNTRPASQATDTFKPRDIGGAAVMDRVDTAPQRNNDPDDDIPF